MKAITIQRYEHKRARLYLTNNKLYTGLIISVSEDVCEIRDKFRQQVAISNEAIQQIELLEGDEDDGKKSLS